MRNAYDEIKELSIRFLQTGYPSVLGNLLAQLKDAQYNNIHNTIKLVPDILPIVQGISKTSGIVELEAMERRMAIRDIPFVPKPNLNACIPTVMTKELRIVGCMTKELRIVGWVLYAVVFGVLFSAFPWIQAVALMIAVSCTVLFNGLYCEGSTHGRDNSYDSE